MAFIISVLSFEKKNKSIIAINIKLRKILRQDKFQSSHWFKLTLRGISNKNFAPSKQIRIQSLS